MIKIIGKYLSDVEITVQQRSKQIWFWLPQKPHISETEAKNRISSDYQGNACPNVNQVQETSWDCKSNIDLKADLNSQILKVERLKANLRKGFKKGFRTWYNIFFQNKNTVYVSFIYLAIKTVLTFLFCMKL